MRARIWLIFKKLNLPAESRRAGDIADHTAGETRRVSSVGRMCLSETIAWAVPCVSGRGRRIAPNLFGALVATNEEPRKLVFVARKGRAVFRKRSSSMA